MVILNHIIIYKLLVLNKNTLYRATVCQQVIIDKQKVQLKKCNGTLKI